MSWLRGRTLQTLSQRIALLKKIRRFFLVKQGMFYYNSLIKQVMIYGSTAWTSCSVDNLIKVLKLQKRVARVILSADNRDKSFKLFSWLGWLPFYDEAKINQCLLIRQCLVGDCPQYMNIVMTRNSDIHHRKSRYGQWNLVCKRFNRETEDGRTFSVSSAKLWNLFTTWVKDKIKVSNSNLDLRKCLNAYFCHLNEDIRHFKVN